MGPRVDDEALIRRRLLLQILHHHGQNVVPVGLAQRPKRRLAARAHQVRRQDPSQSSPLRAFVRRNVHVPPVPCGRFAHAHRSAVQHPAWPGLECVGRVLGREELLHDLRRGDDHGRVRAHPQRHHPAVVVTDLGQHSARARPQLQRVAEHWPRARPRRQALGGPVVRDLQGQLRAMDHDHHADDRPQTQFHAVFEIHLAPAHDISSPRAGRWLRLRSRAPPSDATNFVIAHSFLPFVLLPTWAHVLVLDRNRVIAPIDGPANHGAPRSCAWSRLLRLVRANSISQSSKLRSSPMRWPTVESLGTRRCSKA
ncbi:hypothetical protein MPTK2_3g17570 [Marchantia polymorpha subsp. ruderalis]